MPKAPPGDLTSAGMLYEGSDFSEWRSRMNAILRVKGLDRHSSEGVEVFRRGQDKPPTPAMKRATRIISTMVSPSIHRRVTSKGKLLPSQLWEQLEMLCKPFRFLDLSPELRDVVYGFTCADWTGNGWTKIDGPLNLPVTGVSTLVRLEARRVFYRNTKFMFDPTDNYFPAPLAIVADCGALFHHWVREWAQHTAGSDKRYIRYCQICHCGYDRTINLRLTRGTDLSIDYFDEDDRNCKIEHEVPAAAAQKVIQDYVDKINGDAKVLGLDGGNVILLALMSDPELWIEDAFEWEEAEMPKAE